MIESRSLNAPLSALVFQRSLENGDLPEEIPECHVELAVVLVRQAQLLPLVVWD